MNITTAIFMLKQVCYIFVWLLILNGFGFSKSIPIYVDYCTFRKSDSENYLEIYYGFIDTVPTFREDKGLWVANLGFKINIYQNDSLLDNLEWDIIHQKEQVRTEGYENLLVGQKNFVIPSGRIISFTFECNDYYDTTKKFLKTFELESPRYSLQENVITLSCIQFAQFTERMDTSQQSWQREFLKGKFYVVPNPTCEVIGSHPTLFYYFEYYSAQKFLGKTVIVEFRLIDGLQNEVYLTNKKIKISNPQQYELSYFNLELIPTGRYTFEITFRDENRNVVGKSQQKIFYLINLELPPKKVEQFTEDELYERSIFATLDERDAQKEFEKITYLANDYEKELFKSLQTLDGRRRFLFRFWKKRNPDTTLVYNQAYDEFNRKIEYANKFFSVGNQIEGWKTDRGRVLIQYGEPTTREFHPREGNKKSYEIWFYSEIQGGAFFYFVDVIGNGNYILVHSNAIGEVQNENWYTDFVTGTNEERLKKMLLIR